MRVRKAWLRKLEPKHGAAYKSHKSCPYEVGWREPVTKSVRREYYATLNMALERQQEIFAIINDGQNVREISMSWSTAISRYVASLTCKDSTITEYQRTLNQFSECLKMPDSSRWTYEAIVLFVRKRLKDKTSAPTINKDLRHLNAFFSWAVERKIIKDNPVVMSRLKVKEPHKRIVVWTPEQFQKVIKKCPNDKWRLFLYMLINGVGRTDDLLALKIDQIDMDNQCVCLVSEKTGVYRSVPLHSSTYELLRRYTTNNKLGVYLFKTKGIKNPKPPVPCTFKQSIWKEICLTAQVPWIKMHSLRGCAATWLAMRNKSSTAAMSLLGHKSQSTTLRWYTNLEDQDLLNSAVNSLPI
jgi:integrase